MGIVNIAGKTYNPNDLDCNGNPYKDAVPVEDKVNLKWRLCYNSFNIREELLPKWSFTGDLKK
jgi:hypothetical protein